MFSLMRNECVYGMKAERDNLKKEEAIDKGMRGLWFGYEQTELYIHVWKCPKETLRIRQ